jgi:hypothetical protein
MAARFDDWPAASTVDTTGRVDASVDEALAVVR